MAPLITVLATHTWTSAGGTLVMSTKLNQLDPLSSGEDELWPRVVLDSVKGLRALPDMDDNREDNTESNGESPLPGYARGKTLTYSGRIYGSSWTNAHQGADNMLLALGPDVDTGELQTGFMVIAPDLPDTDQALYGGICRACEIVERIDIPSDLGNEHPSVYRFDFTFDIRMSDGRYVEWDPEGGSGGDGEVVADSFKW